VNGNGNSADFIRDIMLDTKPPELISYKVFPAKISGRALVRFEVKATDPSGLKSTAKIVCQIGEILYTEYLRFEKVSGFYRGNAYYTVNTSSEIKIKLILLEDQLGNQQEYNFFEK
jgi:hypothetical protein